MLETTEVAQAAARRLLAHRGAGAPSPELVEAMRVALEAVPATDPGELADEIDRCIAPELTALDLPEAVRKMQPHIADVALALACRRGDAAALRAFERAHIATLGPAIGRIDANAAFVDEVRQRVRTKLLVPAAGGKLLHYTGKGELGTWVRVVAVREAIDLRRGPGGGSGREVGDDALADLPESATGPELGIVKHEYREHFATAFTAALEALGPAQRNLLRLHYLHGVGIDELGGLLAVHRSSAARRIEKARKELLSLTRRRLQSELAIGRPELIQLMDAIASRLDLSLERYLVAE